MSCRQLGVSITFRWDAQRKVHTTARRQWSRWRKKATNVTCYRVFAVATRYPYDRAPLAFEIQSSSSILNFKTKSSVFKMNLRVPESLLFRQAISMDGQVNLAHDTAIFDLLLCSSNFINCQWQKPAFSGVWPFPSPSLSNLWRFVTGFQYMPWNKAWSLVSSRINGKPLTKDPIPYRDFLVL